ncbi:hypothetical protein A2V82_06750, partial [candidate division KSB1 bacterium RBG_16_48_16]
MGSRKKYGAAFYLRLAISLGLILYILNRVGLEALWDTIRTANLSYLVLSISITPVLILVSSWKWHVILAALGVRYSFGGLFWLYVVGYFFNTVLPTNVGGDVVRAVILGKKTGKNPQAFSSVFVERFTGLTALLLMAIVAFLLAIRKLWDAWIGLALLLALVGYAILLYVLLEPKILKWMGAKIPVAFLRKLIAKTEKFQSATLALKHKKAALVFAMANSLLFYLVAVFNVYVTTLVFHPGITLADCFIITPIVLVITMIPLSIGGIGLSEGAYVFTFTRLGLVGAVGLSVAFLMRAKALVAGIVGGIYYSFMGMGIKEELSGPAEMKTVDDGDVQGKVDYFSGFEDVMRRKKSPLAKYQDIVIGNGSLWELCKYELITALWAACPGVIGYFSRQVFYRFILGSIGKGSVFGKNVTIRHGKKIFLGKRCVAEEYSMLSAQGDEHSAITLGNEVLLGRGTVLSTRNGTISIGDYSNIGAN